QDFVVSFPTETVSNPKFLGRYSGYYMDIKTSTTTWDINGKGTWGLFTLGLDFGQNGFFRSLNNNGIAFTSLNNHGQSDSGNGFNPQFLTWDSWNASCNSCRSSGAAFCDCPSATDIANHDKAVNWGDAQYRNLSDATLPYTSPSGGVTGKLVYR